MNTTSSHDVRVQKALSDLEAIRLSEEEKRRIRLQEVYLLDDRIREIDDELSKTGFNAMNLYLATKGEMDKEALKEKLKKENALLRKERADILSGFGLPADYTDLRFQCPDCQDTGFIGTKRCHCLNQRLIRMAYQSSNLENAITAQNFDSSDLSRFPDTPFQKHRLTPYQNSKVACQYLQNYAASFPSVSPLNIFFYGAPGTGKTFLCNCLAKALLDRGFSVLYMMSDDLCEVLERKRMNRDNESDETLLEQIETADLLIIDDLGCEFKTQLSTSLLLNLINSRIVGENATVISTNLTVADLKKEYSERLSSRIMGHYQVIELFGPDQRQIKP